MTRQKNAAAARWMLIIGNPNPLAGGGQWLFHGVVAGSILHHQRRAGGVERR
jgi:hypothetical protein